MFTHAFSHIHGHQSQKDYFSRIIERNNLAHAYCFEGLEGIGKFAFAQALARWLLTNGEKDLQIKFDTDNHPDYCLIVPDGASIKTEQIEALHGFVYIKPYLSSLKVVIIDNAPLMTEQAQNKLLKLIEEPPGHVLFILIADNVHRLLPTVRSRIIRLSFKPLTVINFEALIFEKNLDRDEALIDLSAGSIGSYIKWSLDLGFREGVEQLMVVLTGLCENKSSKWLKHMSVFESLKDDGILLLELMRLWLCDLALVLEGTDPSLLRLSFQYENMVQCSRYVKSSALMTAIDAVDEGIDAIGRQQNYLLVTESVLYRIQEALHG